MRKSAEESNDWPETVHLQALKLKYTKRVEAESGNNCL